MAAAKKENEKKYEFSDNTPEIEKMADIVQANNQIDPTLYLRYNVKRGLRDISGRGVLTGLTEIAEVKSYTIDDDELVEVTPDAIRLRKRYLTSLDRKNAFREKKKLEENA